MNSEINFIQARATEDQLQQSALKRPSLHQHHANPVKDSDSMLQKIWASRDLFHQTHSDILDTIKYALKTSIFGGSLGTAVYVTHLYEESTFANRKAFTYADSHKYGHAKIFWKFSRQFFFIGAFAGAAWNFWWNMFLTNHEHDNSLGTYIAGYGIYSAVAFGLYHPRLYLTGGLLGGIFGTAIYCITYAQTGSDSTRIGFAYELPQYQITDEQKELQNIKDQILYLGQINMIKNHTMQEI